MYPEINVIQSRVLVVGQFIISCSRRKMKTQHLRSFGAPTLVMPVPWYRLSIPAQYAAASHMGQGRDEEYITHPVRLRFAKRLAASRIASISAWAVGSPLMTTRLGACATTSSPRTIIAP